MNDIKKPNDWFVAQLENPSFTMDNFRDVGLTADNTGLLDKNTYRNSKFVQEMFKDENGKFNEVAFNQSMIVLHLLIRSLPMTNSRIQSWRTLIGTHILN